MEIREAVETDIGQIISLMKSSLGEELMPKSEAFYRWKHEQNPFGKSKILVATEGRSIVGLRTFMKWKWVSGNQIISAVRAVDTATHPDFQGRGIFKKITLQAVEECKKEGIGLVFNTPNPISKQGYLKMGWEEAGRLPLLFGLGSLFPRWYDALSCDQISNDFSVASQVSKFDFTSGLNQSSQSFHTPIDNEYIFWRYAQCPVSKYGLFSNDETFCLLFRLKRLKKFIELRICDIWSATESDTNLLFHNSLKALIKIVRPIIVSCAPISGGVGSGHSISGLYGPYERGPVVTLRNLTLANLDSFHGFNNWTPSLGSMELF